MHTELITQLRSDLTHAEYQLSRVRSLIGAEADAARERGVLSPALRIMRGLDRSALQVLVRCFLLGDVVTGADLETAFPALGMRGLVKLNLVRESQDGVDGCTLWQAALSVNPVEIEDSLQVEPLHWWLISDLDDHLRRGPAEAHHVMGVGGATRSLIAQAPVAEVRRALDLGTGCGVVALHLALRGPVVATDISERALTFARANAQLNEVVGIDFRQGDLFDPVAGEHFDLILSNPPFVVTPRSTTTTYEYRDAGMVGDALAARVIEEAPSHLLDDGTLLCLANWESPWGIDGTLRVSEWINQAAVRAGIPAVQLASWLIERDRVSPIRYAETWARDGGARPGENVFDALLSQWIEDFAERQIVALGLGSVRIRRIPAAIGNAETPIRHTERASGAFSGRAGVALESAFSAGIIAAQMPDSEILNLHWYRAPGVVEIREYQPGSESPQALFLQIHEGIERQVVADPLLAAALGASDGDLSLEQISNALATLLEVDAEAAAEALVAGFRELAWMGMVTPWVPTGV